MIYVVLWLLVLAFVIICSTFILFLYAVWTNRRDL